MRITDMPADMTMAMRKNHMTPVVMVVNGEEFRFQLVDLTIDMGVYVYGMRGICQMIPYKIPSKPTPPPLVLIFADRYDQAREHAIAQGLKNWKFIHNREHIMGLRDVTVVIVGSGQMRREMMDELKMKQKTHNFTIIRL